MGQVEGNHGPDNVRRAALRCGRGIPEFRPVGLDEFGLDSIQPAMTIPAMTILARIYSRTGIYTA